jgi:hypothetical protein
MYIVPTGRPTKRVSSESCPGRRQGETTIIHGLENGVGVVVGVRGDLDQMNIFDQPVHKVRQRLTQQILGKMVLDVGVASENVRNRCPSAA